MSTEDYEGKIEQQNEELIKGLQEAEEHLSNMDLDAAREIYTELSVKFPKDGRAWAGLAKVYFLEGEYDESARHYKKCLLVAPSLGIFHKITELATSADKLYKMAQALYRQDLYQEAFKFTDIVVEMDIEPNLRSDVLTLREELRRLIDKYEKGIEDDSFKKTQQKYRLIFNLLGLILALGAIGLVYYLTIKFGKGPTYSDAKEAYQSASDALENYKINERGGKHAYNRFVSAEKKILEALKGNPDDYKIHYVLAKTYLKWYELDQLRKSADEGMPVEDHRKMAIKELKKVIEINPNFPEAYITLAVLKYQDKEYKDAKEYLEKALDSLKYYTADEMQKTNLRKRIHNLLKRIEKEGGVEEETAQPEEKGDIK